ncbi:helix-turn-helix domain-containing protein [Gracilibacillus oryzae]|uniref:Helix-turn-helix domain-containing protein n=1 Tax=Gracilibacillus oryzae TaxID=1672701 RepID=A0A7C8GRJ9_9BACI|nr:XRE family transcriptional regulator [Gracilibacillus oryzae]KAB8126938.1 helix-turn-helix domain-containing protein [Gracilibacillus oryzae]
MNDKKTVQIQRKILSDNLKRLLNSKGKTQTDMARELGLSETTVSSWINSERYPRLDKIQLMADYFGVYRSAITEEEKNKFFETNSRYNYFPLHISAGVPDMVDPITVDNIETISLPDSILGKWAGDQDIIITKVNGESMNKVIPHQSLIAIKPYPIENINDGDIVVYSHNNEFSVKRMYRSDGSVIFRPSSFDTRFTDNVIPVDDSNLFIHGKVVTYVVNLD